MVYGITGVGALARHFCLNHGLHGLKDCADKVGEELTADPDSSRTPMNRRTLRRQTEILTQGRKDAGEKRETSLLAPAGRHVRIV